MARKANARKTFEVEAFKDWVNERLADDHPSLTQDFKRGLATALERVLHDTGNYAGFQNLYWQEQGYREWKDAGEPGFPEKEQYITGGEEYSRIYY